MEIWPIFVQVSLCFRSWMWQEFLLYFFAGLQSDFYVWQLFRDVTFLWSICWAEERRNVNTSQIFSLNVQILCFIILFIYWVKEKLIHKDFIMCPLYITCLKIFLILSPQLLVIFPYKIWNLLIDWYFNFIDFSEEEGATKPKKPKKVLMFEFKGIYLPYLHIHLDTAYCQRLLLSARTPDKIRQDLTEIAFWSLCFPNFQFQYFPNNALFLVSYFEQSF